LEDAGAFFVLTSDTAAGLREGEMQKVHLTGSAPFDTAPLRASAGLSVVLSFSHLNEHLTLP
jgi:hypothetical protein